MESTRARAVLVMVVCAALGAVGCGSSLTDSLGGGGGNGMSATVNGQSWSSGISTGLGSIPAVTASLLDDPSTGGKQLVITGTKTDGNTGTSISISFVSTSGFPKGSYTVVDSSGGTSHDGDAFAQVTWTNDETFDGASGTLTLGSYSSSSASGTFQFTARNSAGTTLNVTGGHFQSDVGAQ